MAVITFRHMFPPHPIHRRKLNTYSFDKVADTYDLTRSYPSEIMGLVIHKLVKVLGKRVRILDAGCGTARYTMPLQKYGFEVIGLDSSKKMLEKAHAKGTQNILLGDLRLLPFKNKIFDAVLSNHVLHLVKPWRQAIAELCRVGKKDAIFLTVNGSGGRLRRLLKEYRSVCRKYNFRYRHPGRAEAELTRFVAPVRKIPICLYVAEWNADEVLAELDTRSYSIQWPVSENIHRKVMRELRKKYSGTRFKTQQNLRLLVWKIDDLRRTFCQRPRAKARGV